MSLLTIVDVKHVFSTICFSFAPVVNATQSNAMVAIAAVVASKAGSSFVYYTKPVPRWLRRNPVGNFARALALGAEVGGL